jgi:hypothetical protein
VESIILGKCDGTDLRGCPENERAIYKTNSTKTWKGPSYRATLLLCENCKEKLLEQEKKDQEVAVPPPALRELEAAWGMPFGMLDGKPTE